MNASWSVHKNFIRFGLLCTALAAIASSCGKQGFEVAKVNAGASSPGSYVIQPKVDIILGENDSGSMYEVFRPVSDQMPGFLQGLQNSGWDYHFATTPLDETRTMSQVTASQYDPNWGSQWMPPYPGARMSSFEIINPNVFETTNNYTGFIQIGDVSNSSNGVQTGFETLWQTANGIQQGTGLVRPDALLVLIVVSTDDDTSGMTGNCYYYGMHVYCGNDNQTTLTNYKNEFQGLKGASQVRMFSAVANETDCMVDGKARVGTRYQWMAQTLGGQWYDLCTTPISNILSGISANLSQQKLSFKTQYLFIADPAQVSTIVVTKYSNGTAQVIPQDPNNGWTYMGDSPVTVYAINYPTQMNLTTGIAIRLNGSAELVGSDTANVTFTPKNMKNTP